MQALIIYSLLKILRCHGTPARLQCCGDPGPGDATATCLLRLSVRKVANVRIGEDIRWASTGLLLLTAEQADGVYLRTIAGLKHVDSRVFHFRGNFFMRNGFAKLARPVTFRKYSKTRTNSL